MLNHLTRDRQIPGEYVKKNGRGGALTRPLILP